METSVPINFTNKEYTKDNCYIANLIIDNTLHAPNRTFFPAEWSQEKVVSKIYEAYDNFKKNGAHSILNRKGKYTIRGFTTENIEIEMIFTTNGEMKTAYPIID